MDGHTPFLIPSVVVLRSLLQEPNQFDDDLLIREDTDMFFRLAFGTKFCFVAERLVRIDRTKTRADGLEDLLSAPRDDRKFENLQRLYSKWLAMPQVVGTDYERRIKNLFELICYNSAECKIHQLRLRLALREIARLRRIGNSYVRIVSTLLTRKATKARNRLLLQAKEQPLHAIS